MSGKAKKQRYFHNRWREVKELPEDMIPQLEAEEILEKSWSLVPSKCVVIRCEDRNTGKIKEYSFQREGACVNRIKQMQDTHEITICTDDMVGVVLNEDDDESDYD